MTADATFSKSLHSFGFIEAISRFGEYGVQKEKIMSLEDYVGKITAIFSPTSPQQYLKRNFHRLK